MRDFIHLPYRLTPAYRKAATVAARQQAAQRAGANNRPGGFEASGLTASAAVRGRS